MYSPLQFDIGSIRAISSLSRCSKVGARKCQMAYDGYEARVGM